MKQVIKRFLADETAAAKVEYGLLVACLWLAVLSTVNAMGKSAAITLR